MSRVEKLSNDLMLYHGDCLELLPTLPSFDAVVSDPPYGIGFTGVVKRKNDKFFNGKCDSDPFAKQKIYGDDKPFDPTPWLKFPCALFGGDHFASRLPDGVFHVWDKDPKGLMARDCFSDAELVWTNKRMARRVFRYLWKGVAVEGNVPVRRLHQTMKPVQVMEWCLDFYPKAQTILDPYMGSGTTGVACVRRGKRFIGVEIDATYFDVACRRIEEELRRPRLEFEAPGTSDAHQATLL